MALTWLFSPKCGTKPKIPSKLQKRTSLGSTAKKVETVAIDVEVSEKNNDTEGMERSGSSLDSTSMPSSVVVGLTENATIVSEIEEEKSSLSGNSTESSQDYMNNRSKVGSGRSMQAKDDTNNVGTHKVGLSRVSSSRFPAMIKRSFSSKILGGNNTLLPAVMRKKPILESRDTHVLETNLDVELKDSPSACKPLRETYSMGNKSDRSQAPSLDIESCEEIGCDSTTIRRGLIGKPVRRDNCPELPHRQVSMSPEEIKRRQVVKEKKKKHHGNAKEKKTNQSGPNVPPEYLESYMDQLQMRRKKQELVRRIRGKRAEEEDTKRKEFSSEEMDEYLSAIQEVRMAKKQAKSRAMQEAMAMQRADFLARLIHVSETENKAASPVTPPANSRI